MVQVYSQAQRLAQNRLFVPANSLGRWSRRMKIDWYLLSLLSALLALVIVFAGIAWYALHH